MKQINYRKFTLAMMRLIPGNMVFSPWGIATAILMCAIGARGSTRREMLEPLDLVGANDEELVELLVKQAQQFSVIREVSIVSANKVLVGNGLQLVAAFSTFMEKIAGLERVDYNRPQVVVDMVNEFVAEVTHNHIKNLLEPGSLSTATKIVLVAANYFKGDWTNAFQKEDTRVQAFYGAERPVGVDMMHQTTGGIFSYADVDAFQMLRMPYLGGFVNMDVVLPKSGYSLPDVEASLPDALMSELLRSLFIPSDQIAVSLPKFEERWGTNNITPTLQGMGICTAFSDAADFSNMSPTPLYISAVYHQAFIHVDEDGTVGASGTAIETRTLSAPAHIMMPIEFTADHPFLYIVGTEDCIFFAGRMEQPEGEPITAVEQTRELLPHGAFMRSPEERG